jgi:hypothetical protein
MGDSRHDTLLDSVLGAIDAFCDFAGFSSGANVAAAVRLLQTAQQGKTIAVLLCDSGLKYLSTDLWI